jgi:hypothetical protein
MNHDLLKFGSSYKTRQNYIQDVFFDNVGPNACTNCCETLKGKQAPQNHLEMMSLNWRPNHGVLLPERSL